ncbi:MAG: DUF1883 domain-containing protein [Planctomycetes bacterium]|nr:DUF1883 domain-containing protein [Planctomycetota bacterium]
MDHLHNEFDLKQGDVIEVTLNHPANVQLMDTPNYQSYRNGRPFRYFGGHVKTSPFKVDAPRSGHWHLAIDLGGNAGTVRASVQVISTTQA